MDRKSYQTAIKTVIKSQYLPFIQTIQKHTLQGVQYVLIYNVLAELKLSGCTFGSYEVYSCYNLSDMIAGLRTIARSRPITGYEFLKTVERDRIQEFNYATDYAFLQSVSGTLRNYFGSLEHISQQPQKVTSALVESRIYNASRAKRRYL